MKNDRFRDIVRLKLESRQHSDKNLINISDMINLLPDSSGGVKAKQSKNHRVNFLGNASKQNKNANPYLLMNPSDISGNPSQ
jgi:hypothetical protein